ncbi:conserved hypothetical protein [Polaromonas naphthalenivorans CJ2]|uniref:Uncharacterized protein n=2 Tax=Polaromonas naphthalenivorans TaxID=216465 RepID=A1VLL4_POLNA|nr:conserved hypothetical protein [Polaromonas naphthalenivorans CJ2]
MDNPGLCPGAVTTLLASIPSFNPPGKRVPMDIFMLAMFVAIGAHMFKSKYQSRRIALLGSHLGKYQIEKLMETLTDGYMRALGEADGSRREQIFNLLGSTEASLCDQLGRLAVEFSKVDEADARVSKLPVAIPYADKLFPAATFDLRKALAIHAQGINRAVRNEANRSPKAKAFTVSAELFLLQHTCHWFCKSKTVASARMLARQKTSYEQLVESVAPETRRAYCSLTGG